MSLIETKGKPYVLVCDNCGNYRRLAAEFAGPISDTNQSKVPIIPVGWDKDYCFNCREAIGKALEARRGSNR